MQRSWQGRDSILGLATVGGGDTEALETGAYLYPGKAGARRVADGEKCRIMGAHYGQARP